MTTNPTDGRHAHAAATKAKLIDAWVQVVSRGERPTREAVIAEAGVSRASYNRLTSVGELGVLGTELQLAQLKRPVTSLLELDETIRHRCGLLNAAAARVDIEVEALDRVDRESAELRRLLAVRAKWEGIK